ncbi:MAG: transcription antitermination factor NusB [Alloprevotella sp.]|nr:transcription antitermination factor NusB [Alloprevotella sp.]
MINRALIRLKVVQLVYAYYKDGEKTPETALKELDFSLSKAYELYFYLLNQLVSLQEYGERKAEALEARATRMNLNQNLAFADKRFSENKILLQLKENPTLAQYRERREEWEEEPSFIKDLYNRFTQSDDFQAYLDAEDFSYEADREIIRRLYKTIICQNDDFEQLLEDHSLYWNDDKEIVDSFVLKTIRRYNPNLKPEEELLPKYDSQEDEEFGQRLYKAVLEREEETRQLIQENAQNWEFSRLPFMDIIIMQIALAEILTFNDIPLNVSFSEYLDIAKIYSTPKSSRYINGLLDHVVKKLRAEGKLLK